MKKKVLISGAGTAGLATALMLDRRKFDIHIVERADTFANKGFSIILWKSGYEVLEKLVGKQHLKQVHPIKKISMYGGDNFEYLHSADSTKEGHAVERKVLVDALATVYINEFGYNNIRFNTSVNAIDYNNRRPLVTFSNCDIEQFDLVIACDGMHSFIRDAHFESSKQTADYTVTYLWVKPGLDFDQQAIIATHGSFILLVHSVGERVLVGYYNHNDLQENQAFLGEVKAFLETNFNGSVEFDTKSQMDFMSERIHVERAYDRSIVLVGDAYHGHSPTLALGTSIALEDASVLADELNMIESKNFDSSLKSALQYYDKNRSKRIKDVYGLQDLVEKLYLDKNQTKVKLLEKMYKHGGWIFIEPWLRRLISK